MRHAEVAESPCQRGDNRQRRVRAGLACNRIIGLCKAEVAGQLLRAGDDLIPAAGRPDTETKHRQQCNRHDDGLNKIRERRGKKSAGCRIEHDDDRADDHREMIIHSEQRMKKLPAGRKSGRRIGNEKNDDPDRCQKGQYMLCITVPVGEKLRQRNRVRPLRVAAQLLRDQQPVEIRTAGQPDYRPPHIRSACEICQSRQTHQQITAHIRSLGAHRRDQRPELPASQIEIADRLVFLRQPDSDAHHRNQIDAHRRQHQKLCSRHIASPSRLSVYVVRYASVSGLRPTSSPEGPYT